MSSRIASKTTLNPGVVSFFFERFQLPSQVPCGLRLISPKPDEGSRAALCLLESPVRY